VVTAGELKSGSEPISLSTENCIALIQAIVQYDFWPKGGYLQPAKVTVAGLRLESFPAVATMHKKRALYDRLDFQGTVMSDSGSVPGSNLRYRRHVFRFSQKYWECSAPNAEEEMT